MDLDEIYNIAVGQNIIKENIRSFADSSLKSEMVRLGDFNIATMNPDYELEVKIDSISSTGYYRYHYRAIVVYSIGKYGFGYPLAKIYSTLYLKNKSQTVFTKSIATEHRIPFKFKLHSPFLVKYSKSLVENLSLALKENNEAIVKEVNTFLGDSNR